MARSRLRACDIWSTWSSAPRDFSDSSPLLQRVQLLVRLALMSAQFGDHRRAAGGELEQIQLLLGHASVQTTERYLGTKQDLVHAPNDGIKLRVAV